MIFGTDSPYIVNAGAHIDSKDESFVKLKEDFEKLSPTDHSPSLDFIRKLYSEVQR